MAGGAGVPGASYELGPVQAASSIGAMIRWLDFNDTWLAAEWGHPSDNLGGILATADWLSRTAVAEGRKPLAMKDVLTAMIKAHEVQGVIALENSFNRVGLDHVVLFKISCPAEFHAGAALACAIALHPQGAGPLDDIARLTIRTHESASRIVDEKGTVANPADRDHCIQYMVVVPLISGRLTAAAY